MTAPVSPSAPPTPPGSLTSPPAAGEVLAYLDALDRWVGAWRASLDALDTDAQASKTPSAYTADIALAMSLWSSIDARHTELLRAWDSGRVGRDELAHIATLLWGRLPDPFGNPSAFTLTEACTLAAALLDRVRDALDADPIAGSGAAGRVVPVRAAIERCRAQAAVLAEPTDSIDALASELDSVVGGSDRRAIADTVARVDAKISRIERDLIMEAAARASLAADVARLHRRHGELAAREAAVHELADRCRSRIVDPPRLAVPSVAALGEPCDPPSGAAPAEWRDVRAQVDDYAGRLERVDRALAEARQRYAAPLDERAELRGLLGAYRDRAARLGLAEDLALADRYEAAHEVLWSEPCSLSGARVLVEEYQDAVRRATGSDAPSDDAEEPR